MKNKSDFPSLNTKQPDGLKPNGRPYRMMVVEDKEFLRKQIAQIFESERYEVVATAGNGREAMDKYELLDGNVDILTTNLDMPVLDGYALMFEFTQKTRRPIVVFISEDTTKGVMHDLINMGISDFILKPINRRVILERVKAAIVKAKI